QRIPGLGRLLQALGVNSIPAAGFFGEGWSIGTTLLLYWVETLVVILLAHHRGQLTVYLRLNDAPMPSVYGPSADDKAF
ncbi:MAG: DinB family protein, partial [Thermoanaerobaculia bacterium]|nr:DinB family protein [Thermoanaerobaculia bacterium]